MKKPLIFFFLFAFIFPTFVQGQNNLNKTFKEANDAYLARDFDKANALYRQLLTEGGNSSTLHFNLGNTLYRQGKMGEAIYHYEKAHRLNPRDRDLSANLSYVKSHLGDKIETPVLTKISSYLYFINGLLSLKESLVLTLIFYASLFGMLLWRNQNKTRSNAIAILFFTLINLYTLPAFALKYYAEVQDSGVLISPQEAVYSEPTDKSLQLFVIHEGVDVKILGEENGFYKISLADGKKGWLKKEGVAAL